MENTSGSLVAALVAAQAGVGQVVKESKNSAMGYKYASSESIIEAASDALSKNGLALYSTEWSTKYENPKEGDVATGRLTVLYRLEHISGQTREFKTDTAVCTSRGRLEDKSEAAALTMNLGYFLRNLLLVAREDEPEAVDKRDDSKSKKAAPVATSVDAAPWIATIAMALDGPALSAIGKELSASKLASVPEIRDAYMTAAKKHGLVK